MAPSMWGLSNRAIVRFSRDPRVLIISGGKVWPHCEGLVHGVSDECMLMEASDSRR